MSKQSDKSMRLPLRAHLARSHAIDQTSCRHFEEYQLSSSVIADYLIITPDWIAGYEIKSDYDNSLRLSHQVPAYDAVCNYRFIVVPENLTVLYNELVPKDWGILTTKDVVELDVTIARYATEQKDDRLNLHALAELVRKEDLCHYISFDKCGEFPKFARSSLLARTPPMAIIPVKGGMLRRAPKENRNG